MIPHGAPYVERWHRSNDGTISGTVRNVSPEGILDRAARLALATLVAEAAGESLPRFHDVTVTRYSLDASAVVVLHST